MSFVPRRPLPGAGSGFASQEPSFERISCRVSWALRMTGALGQTSTAAFRLPAMAGARSGVMSIVTSSGPQMHRPDKLLSAADQLALSDKKPRHRSLCERPRHGSGLWALKLANSVKTWPGIGGYDLIDRGRVDRHIIQSQLPRPPVSILLSEGA